MAKACRVRLKIEIHEIHIPIPKSSRLAKSAADKAKSPKSRYLNVEFHYSLAKYPLLEVEFHEIQIPKYRNLLQVCDIHCQFFFTARRFASAVLATAIPSVRPSVTRRYCVKTVAKIYSSMQYCRKFTYIDVV